MSDKNTVELILNAKSEKFREGMRRGEQALVSFRRFAQKVGRTVQILTQEIGFLGNAATALTTGLALKKLFSVTDYMPVDDALLRMRNNFKNTAEEMDSFKKQLSSLSGKTGAGQGVVFQMASKLSLTYKPEDVVEIIKQSDRISKATQLPIEQAQEGLTQIMKLYKLSGKEAPDAADKFITSRANAETFDTIMQRLAIRSGSKKDYVEQLGFLRGLGIAGIDKPRSIMQLNEAMEMIEDKADIIQSRVKVFNTDASGNRVWREKLEVIKDLEQYLTKVKKTMSIEKFNEALDKEFGVPKSWAKLEFMFSHLKDFEAGIEEMGKSGEIAAGRVAAGEATWETQLNRIKSHLGGIKSDLSFIYDLAKKPIKFFAEHENLTKAGGYAVAGVSVAVLTALGYGNVKNILKKIGKTGAGIAEGKAIEAATGVTPVFVTNWPGGSIGGGGDTALKTAAGVGIMSWLTGLLPFALAGASGYSLYKYPGLSGAGVYSSSGEGKFSPGQRSALDEARLWGKEHGLQNYKAEDILANKIQQFFGSSAKPEVKNTINLAVNIDKNGRATVDNGNKDTDVRIDLNRGTPFGTLFGG